MLVLLLLFSVVFRSGENLAVVYFHDDNLVDCVLLLLSRLLRFGGFSCGVESSSH